MKKCTDLQSRRWWLEADAPGKGFERLLELGASLRLGVTDHGVEPVADVPHHVEMTAREEGLALVRRGEAPSLFVGGEAVDQALMCGTDAAFVIGGVAVSAVCRSGHWQPTLAEADGDSVMGLVGRSASMVRLREQVRRLAPLSRPVLIRGESGSGKELVARALHKESGRSGLLHAVNLGGLSAQFADAELFGHERGAFTGAITKRQGAFQTASRGTLFLDEIGDAPPSVQIKLLRVLEEGAIRPLGSDKVLPVNPRLVSATWKNLEARGSDGTFRVDLLHRISTLQIHLPPLRKRKSDVRILSEHLLATFAAELGEIRLCDDALARLMIHAWPGNVRELNSVLYRSAVAASAGQISADVVESALDVAARPARRGVEFSEVKSQLAAHRGNVSATARSLGVPRSTLRAWLRRGDCDVP